MSLIPLSECHELLICPRCRSEIVPGKAHYSCSSDACPCSAAHRFPIVDRWPVMVDFEQSVLIEHDLLATAASSPVSRPKGAGLKERILQYLVPTASPVSAGIIRQFCQLVKSVRERPVVLVVGGGRVGDDNRELYEDPAVRVISFDIYASNTVQFIADAHQIPLRDASVDGVLIQAVLEHVLEPWRVVAEIHRVLGTGGLVYAETPFLQQVHEGPYDFTRFTESGHRFLFKRFEAIRSGVLEGPGTQLLWTINHVANGVFRSRRIGTLFRIAFGWIKHLDRIIPADFATDSACSVFLLGRKSTTELSGRDVARWYRGAQ